MSPHAPTKTPEEATGAPQIAVEACHGMNDHVTAVDDGGRPFSVPEVVPPPLGDPVPQDDDDFPEDDRKPSAERCERQIFPQQVPPPRHDGIPDEAMKALLGEAAYFRHKMGTERVGEIEERMNLIAALIASLKERPPSLPPAVDADPPVEQEDQRQAVQAVSRSFHASDPCEGEENSS